MSTLDGDVDDDDSDSDDDDDDDDNDGGGGDDDDDDGDDDDDVDDDDGDGDDDDSDDDDAAADDDGPAKVSPRTLGKRFPESPEARKPQAPGVRQKFLLAPLVSRIGLPSWSPELVSRLGLPSWSPNSSPDNNILKTQNNIHKHERLMSNV